ncbi:S8 family serine peptidase [Evansella tamaricis]|uniref:S8 family serine peptidase n=1 Tax=Evansella tamaricis TaxID=2069301 RepID=A0ABS6JF97_9BACI|nr:S8 family serine peptidase [Evansella tamaricis]MBU9712188.1 S8 family serine peptidase [Evansella tamaricis]
MHKLITKPFIWFLALALVLSTFSMGAFANSGGKAEELPIAELFGDIELSSSKPTTVIVELTEESIVEAKHKGKNQTKTNLQSKRGQVISQLEAVVNDVEINQEYDYLFSGFSAELAGNEILKLLSIPGVKAVYPNVEYTVDAISVDWDAVNPEMMESAPFIGADDAWDAGFTGEGVTVAIIDTGVDYTHPDLEHAFGEYKGWDFVDKDNDPQETPADDPRGDSTNHGTHVAGTVAANGGIKGVAPDATLLAYRVLGPGGSGSTENVVAGIERAVQDGADIMNLSLGNTLNNPDWATSIALDWAMAEGVVAVTSNGNSGPDNWTVGSPGTSRDAISVGATRLPYNVYTSDIFTSEGMDYPSAKVMGHPGDDELLALNAGEYEFVDVGLGFPADFEGKDLEGKIALISRGEFAFVDKAENAKNAGAVGAIIYNNVAGEHPDVPGMAVPTIKTTLADGEKLLSELENGNNTISFNIEFAYPVGETIADFSSRGPVALTWMIKPDVSAPGVNIVSTIPTHDPEDPYGYSAFQGTSMSAPHVAGAAALLLDAHPDWGVDDVKSALMNTAEDLIDPVTGNSYPHNTQGAGSIRIPNALETDTLVTPGSHSFGKFVKESGRQVERQSFTIKNLSNKRVRYSFDVEFEGNPDGIKVMTSNNLNVPAGKSQNVNFNVQVDTSKLDPGFYEGSITITGGNQVIEVPTILFVGEPDYPRITGAFMEKEGDGEYAVGAYLPGGAEVIEYDIYFFDNGSIGGFVDTIGAFEDAPSPYHEFLWDGTVQGGIDLPSGDWVLAVYAEKAGVQEYKAYLVTKE